MCLKASGDWLNWIERRPPEPKVVGSNPVSPIISPFEWLRRLAMQAVLFFSISYFSDDLEELLELSPLWIDLRSWIAFVRTGVTYL